MRIHVAPTPPSRVVDTSHAQEITAKPTGLWWAERADWLAWCATEMPAKVTPHIYQVDPGEGARLAVLESAEDLRAFTEAFAASSPPGRPWHQAYAIDWPRVATAYDGIDVRSLTAWGPRDGHGRSSGVNPQWLHGAQRWDVPSGCLWRPNPRTQLEPVSHETVRAWFEERDETLPPCFRRPAPPHARMSTGRRGR